MSRFLIFPRIEPTKTVEQPATQSGWIPRLFRRTTAPATPHVEGASVVVDDVLRPMTDAERRAETDWLNNPRGTQWRRWRR